FSCGNIISWRDRCGCSMHHAHLPGPLCEWVVGYCLDHDVGNHCDLTTGPVPVPSAQTAIRLNLTPMMMKSTEDGLCGDGSRASESGYRRPPCNPARLRTPAPLSARD